MDMEPKYWPEVVTFINKIKAIVEKNTVHDDNADILNDNIIAYVEKEINDKGKEPDLEQRYAKLAQLADRILVVSLGKIVGLKKNVGTDPEFTNAVTHFKHALHERKIIEAQAQANASRTK